MADMMHNLCVHCREIFPLQPSTDASHSRHINHHPHVRALVESAKTCSLCKAVQEHWSLHWLQERYPDVTEESFDSLELSLTLKEARLLGSGLSWGLLAGGITAPWHGFETQFKLTVVVRPLGANATAQSSVWSGNDSSIEEKLDVIKSWFTECTSHHPECAPPAHHYPRRLVEIGASGAHLRLVDSSHGKMGNSRYATLSYCWGSIRPLTTTKGNLEIFSNRIPVESIPPTFRESIMVAQNLGLQYIWIDSLCIVQDDPDDWESEAARMKDVYAGSSITISASDAKDTTLGCFVGSHSETNDKLGTGVSQLSITPLKYDDIGFLLRVYEGDVRHCVSTSVLSTRCWGLQEQLLSHRAVYCMRPEVHWKCQRNHNVESGLAFTDRELVGLWNISKITTDDSIIDICKVWSNWMEDYSRRNVTVTKDRLGALAGMVQQYSERTGHKHVLACWEQTMVDELLWMRIGKLVDPSRALSSIPSWSWLSRVGEVSFDFWNRSSTAKVDDYTKIIETSVSWTSEPMVSDLKATTLIVEGPVLQFRLRVDPRATDFNPPYMNVDDEEPDFSTHPIPWRCAGQFDLEKERVDDLFTCLLMKSVTSDSKKSSYVLWETFLLLLPEPDQQGETYRRVGIAMFRGKETSFASAEQKKVRLV